MPKLREVCRHGVSFHLISNLFIPTNPAVFIFTSSPVEIMSMQKQWVEIMRPLRSLLKFRLTGLDNKFTYLTGALSRPLWSDPKHREVQLLVKEFAKSVSEQTYDFVKEEIQMRMLKSDDGPYWEYDLECEKRIFEKYVCRIQRDGVGI